MDPSVYESTKAEALLIIFRGIRTAAKERQVDKLESYLTFLLAGCNVEDAHIQTAIDAKIFPVIAEACVADPTKSLCALVFVLSEFVHAYDPEFALPVFMDCLLLFLSHSLNSRQVSLDVLKALGRLVDKRTNLPAINEKMVRFGVVDAVKTYLKTGDNHGPAVAACHYVGSIAHANGFMGLLRDDIRAWVRNHAGDTSDTMKLTYLMIPDYAVPEAVEDMLYVATRLPSDKLRDLVRYHLKDVSVLNVIVAEFAYRLKKLSETMFTMTVFSYFSRRTPEKSGRCSVVHHTIAGFPKIDIRAQAERCRPFWTKVFSDPSDEHVNDVCTRVINAQKAHSCGRRKDPAPLKQLKKLLESPPEPEPEQLPLPPPPPPVCLPRPPKPTKECATCKSTRKSLSICTRCRGIYYCGTVCQTAGWESHRVDCKAYDRLTL